MKRRPVRGWLIALIAGLVLAVPPYPPRVVEAVYSRGGFPYLQGGLTRLTNFASFAWIDVLVAAVTALTLWRAFRLAGTWRRAGVLSAVWEATRRLARALGASAALFMTLWGFNYRRVPLEQSLHVAPAALTVPDLETAIRDANAMAARVRPAAVAAGAQEYADVAGQLRQPFESALARLGRAPLQTPGRPKVSVILTPYFTWAGIDGMIDPFALESIVHPDLLPFERPFVLAHEWAHLAGDADEAEASAIGWFACMRGDPALQYSAAFYLIVQAGSVLPSPAWRSVAAALDPGVRADLMALDERLRRQQPVVRRAAFRVYDEYLKANRVEDGVASYNRALALILAPPLREAMK